MINKAQYRKEYQQQLKTEAAQNNAIDEPGKAEMLFSEKSNLFYTTSARAERDIQRWMDTLRNQSMSSGTRALALQKLDIELGKNDELQTEVLNILRNDNEPAELRHMALLVLQQISFSSAGFIARRPEFLDALRTLIDEPHEKLRFDAVEILSASGDEYVQRRLMEWLKSPAKALVAPDKAIQFLSYDVHAEYFPLLREIVKNPPDKDCKIEAIRVLGADTASKDLLDQIWKDKREDSEVRTISAVAASAANPIEFSRDAERLIMDDSEDEELRAVCLNAILQSQPQPMALSAARATTTDVAFENFIHQLQRKPDSSPLKAASDTYLYNMELERRNNSE